jgi:hypothetical protein
MVGHGIDGIRGFAAGAGNASVIEEDYGTSFGESIRYKRIPVV